MSAAPDVSVVMSVYNGVLRGAQYMLTRNRPFVLFEPNRVAQEQGGIRAVFALS
jgi:hypothetical protein